MNNAEHIVKDLSDSEKQVIEQLLYKMAEKAYSIKIMSQETTDEENRI